MANPCSIGPLKCSLLFPSHVHGFLHSISSKPLNIYIGPYPSLGQSGHSPCKDIKELIRDFIWYGLNFGYGSHPANWKLIPLKVWVDCFRIQQHLFKKLLGHYNHT